MSRLTAWASHRTFGQNGLEHWSVMYAVGLGTIALIIYRCCKDKLYFCASVLSVFIAMISTVSGFRSEIGQSHRQAAILTLVGLACFAIGVLVSCLKAGLAGRIHKSFNRMMMDIQFSLRSVEEPELPVD